MAYVVCAKWTAKKGEADNVAEAIRKLVPLSRRESGVLRYQPHRDPKNPNVFFIYEQYADAGAYQSHLDSEHVRQHGFDDAIPRLESRERFIYETMDV
jgi:quinol monooxygenase YgiN